MPFVFKINPASDFSDENWSEIFLSISFVDTEIVDFGHFDFVVFDTGEDGDSSDTGYELLFVVPDAHEPLWLVARRGQGPSQKLSGIVEPESVVIVLHVVVGQQDVQFIQLVVVFDVDFAPVQ